MQVPKSKQELDFQTKPKKTFYRQHLINICWAPGIFKALQSDSRGNQGFSLQAFLFLLAYQFIRLHWSFKKSNLHFSLESVAGRKHLHSMVVLVPFRTGLIFAAAMRGMARTQRWFCTSSHHWQRRGVSYGEKGFLPVQWQREQLGGASSELEGEVRVAWLWPGRAPQWAFCMWIPPPLLYDFVINIAALAIPFLIPLLLQ